jgi:hypothetical protein
MSHVTNFTEIREFPEMNRRENSLMELLFLKTISAATIIAKLQIMTIHMVMGGDISMNSGPFWPTTTMAVARGYPNFLRVCIGYRMEDPSDLRPMTTLV